MNPTEQKKHTTVTDTLRRHVNDLDAIHVAEIDRLEALITAEKDAREKKRCEDHTWALEQADKQREYVDRGDQTSNRRLDTFAGRGFWSRLNWLFFGK
jgi:hypothetical protein